eukprot:1159250-Pelagomonas_calceolata.AAC.7
MDAQSQTHAQLPIHLCYRRMFAITRSGEDLLHEFVNWTTFTNQTPLMLACRNGHKEAALLLLSSGWLNFPVASFPHAFCWDGAYRDGREEMEAQLARDSE